MEAGEVRSNTPPRLFHALTVREARPDEWEQSKALRLEMLADSPHAFEARLADASGWDDDRWQTRHTSQLLPDSAVFVALADDDRWVGQMALREFRNYCPPRALLQGVYVSPMYRGGGTAVELLEAVEACARGRCFPELYLDVHEHSHEARRFYQRLGFVETGATSPYPLDPSTRELEMVKHLNQT